jgi:hypothetical protein
MNSFAAFNSVCLAVAVSMLTYYQGANTFLAKAKFSYKMLTTRNSA